MNALIVFFTALFVVLSPAANAAEFACKVARKFDNERQYTSDQLSKGNFSALIEENNSEAFVSRCSYSPSAEKVTCDRYRVDKIAFDEHIKSKKFYVFRSQFDFQIFSDLSFVENNGRGGVSYGKCALTSQ